VAAAIGLYHWRVLRSDGAARAALAPVSAVASPAYGEGLGGGMVVTITGATEQEIRQALSKLPDGAQYTIKR
jgi:hypothetical protein